MSYFIFDTNSHGEDEIWGYGLDEIGIALSDSAYTSLWTLLPEYAGADPLGTPKKWEVQDEVVRKDRELLFGFGLIDCKGNVTELGKEAVKLVTDAYEHDRLQAWDEHYAEEMDALDRKCRERPKYSRYDG